MVQCLARRMSNLKVADQFGGSGPSLCRQETFLHIVCLHPGVYKLVLMTYCNPEGKGGSSTPSCLTCGPRVASYAVVFMGVILPSISFAFSYLSKLQPICFQRPADDFCVSSRLLSRLVISGRFHLWFVIVIAT